MESQKPQEYLETNECEGRYANYFRVGHNAHEFVIDCGQLHEGTSEGACLHTRIITNPAYAKGLLETLDTSIRQYEDSFGIIKEHYDE